MAHSIFSRATECLDLFNKCLTLERLKLDADTERHRAAFILWASTIGAFAHKNASADYRLEKHGDIKRTTLGILEELVERLEQLYASANGTPSRPQVPDALHNEIQDTRTASYSIPSSIKSDDSVPELYKAIEGLLDWLIRFAVAIRRAASHNRDIKSEQYSDPNDEGFGDFRATTRDLLDCLRVKRLLGEKETNMAEKTKKDLELNKPREDVYQRIIEGNVGRRKRFLYMRSHDEQLRVKPGPKPLIKEETTKAALPVPNLPPTEIQRLPSENERPNVALTLSVKSSAHTTATSIDPAKVELPPSPAHWKPAATVAASAPAMKVKHHYPAIPKDYTGNGRLKCPYCCLPVELAWGSKLQKKEQEENWRIHVKSDLRPYVCLLATCANPTESFISKAHWIRHMELEHQKKHTRWLCRSRHQTKQIFDREEELVEHMRESHGGSFTEAMLPRLISRGALPAPHIFTCCPLCGFIPEEDNKEHASKETSRQLLSHIGQHLETVALSALPDVLFDSSERSIRSRSSVSSSDGSKSTRRDYLSDQSEIQYLQNEDSMPTEDYLISETEAEDWAWVYRKWSLDPKSPKPFNCPYSKDKLFIDRPKLFRQLTDMLNYSSNERGVRPGPAILIHGPRGAGKSQLAVKYAHRVHRGRKDMSVFWFFGRTIVDFENSSLSPMDNRLLSKAKTDGLEWATRAHSWLQDEKKGEWLAVIDDACLGIDPSSDEEDSFWQLVEKAIPICSHGTLLITSRKRPREGFRNYRTLEVGKMTTEESHALVRAMLLPNDVEEQEVAALANIEERTPLALIEAVDRRHPRLPETCIMLSSLWRGMSSRRERMDETFQDIEIFIKEKVKKLSEDRNYSEALRVHVERIFRERARGKFLWIGIVAKELAKYKASEVEEALEDFPPGLDEVYTGVLLHIDSGRRDIAARILRWVVMAVRPLTLLELSTAIEPTVGHSPVAVRYKRIRDQISYCGDFLVIKKDEKNEKDRNDEEEDDGHVGLIHQSAKDYLLRKRRHSSPVLESFRIDEEVANLEIARRCLDYLQSGALENSKPNVSRDIWHSLDFPLLSYAVLHWHEHAKFLGCSEDIFDLSLPFYHEKSQTRTSWLKAYWGWGKNSESGPPESFTVLHMASYLGILPLVQNLVATEGSRNDMVARLKRSSLLDKTDSHGMTALMRAAEGGHGAIMQLLLDKGANIGLKTMSGETALTIAASSEHEAVIQLLLDNGADVNFAQDPIGQTALMKAARSGSKGVTQLLLKRGADINAVDRFGETALMRAAEGCSENSEATIRLLLETGADINAADKFGKTALMEAVRNGSEAIIRLLVRAGADVDARNIDGETALMKAAKCFSKNSAATIRLLLENGADVNTADYNWKTALMRAAGQEYKDSEADIIATDELGQTTLVRAAEDFSENSEAVIRLLLEVGADPNAQNNHGETALMKAIGKGPEAIIRLLVKAGADVDARNIDGETALMKAASQGHQDILRLLLNAGANTNGKDKHGDTALTIASRLGYEDIVRLLLENGANVNAKGKTGRTALLDEFRWTTESVNQREAIVRLLLKHGADTDAVNEDGETALAIAKEKGRKELLQLLPPD